MFVVLQFVNFVRIDLYNFIQSRLAPLSANRLTLSLRKYNKLQNAFTEDSKVIVFRPHQRTLKRRPSWIGTSTFEISSEALDGEPSQEHHELVDINGSFGSSAIDASDALGLRSRL